MARPVKFTNTNKNVSQGYDFTVLGFPFTLYEKRIIYRLVEIANDPIDGLLLRDNMCRLYKQLKLDGGFEMQVVLPFSAILDPISNEESRNNHYEKIKAACNSLQTRIVEREDDYEYASTPFIYGLKIKKRESWFMFYVSDWVWDKILDLSKGWRTYELFTAMRLKSPYSMRFYELFSKQTTPQTFSLERMREMFYLGDKYSRPASIIERIIKPSKEELDSCAPYSFNFKVDRKGEKPQSPIIGFTFYPISHEENQDKELQRTERISKLTSKNLLGGEIYDTLRYTLGFDYKGISRNKDTIEQGKDVILDFVGFLKSLKDNKGYKTAENKQGYVIKAIRNKTKEILEGNERVRQDVLTNGNLTERIIEQLKEKGKL